MHSSQKSNFAGKRNIVHNLHDMSPCVACLLERRSLASNVLKGISLRSPNQSQIRAALLSRDCANSEPASFGQYPLSRETRTSRLSGIVYLFA